MGSQRLSLSSSVFSDRVKKFDTYEHNSRTSKRATLQPQQQSRTSPPTLQLSDAIGVKPKQPTPVNRPQMHGTSAPSLQQKQRAENPSVKIGVIKQTSVSSKGQGSIRPVHKLAMAAVAKTPATNKSIIADQFQGMNMSSAPLKKQKRSKLQTMMYSFAGIIFLFASAVTIQTFITNQQTQEVLGEKVQSTDAEGVEEGTGSEPAEGPVSDNAIINYQVAPDMPRYLKIPDIGVFARIKHTGVTAEGAVDAPKNINDVSWYNGGAKPGDPSGSSLLLGHVQGWSAPGVFKKINKLQPGARFTVEKGDGSTLTYEVTRTQDIPLDQVDMRSILSEEVPGEHDLKLMTCSGSYNRDTELYDSRYVVYAKIIR